MVKSLGALKSNGFSLVDILALGLSWKMAQKSIINDDEVIGTILDPDDIVSFR